MLGYFARFSPLRAVRDLRHFFATRESYHWRMMALSAAIVFAIFVGFIHDSRWERPYKPNIIYVEQWPASRSDAEIQAQLAIDKVAKTKRLAEEKRLQDEQQAAYKRLDNKLKAWGL